VFASGSSVQATSSVSAETGGTPEAGAPAKSVQLHGAAAVSVNGVSLEATYHLEPEGLSVVVRGFDGADPNGTRLLDRLLLKPGEFRIIAVQRAHGPPPAHFTITRIGDGVQICANGA
jgi:hypothetical protein